MPGHVLRQRLDAHVDTVLKRLEEMDAPRVVQHCRHPVRAGDGGQGRHVLHLERVAAGAFEVQDARRGAQQRLQPGAVDGGRIVLGSDPHTGQHSVGECAGRAVHVIRQQQVVAGPQIGQQRRGNGSQAGAYDLTPGPALDLRHHVFQRIVGRAAHHAVDRELLQPLGPRRAPVGDGRVQYSRSTLDRRVHKAMYLRPRPPGVGQAGR